MAVKTNIVIILLISGILGAFNLEDSFVGHIATQTQGFIAVAFVISWLLYGFIMSYKKVKYFFWFITLYWGIGMILTLIAIQLQWFILVIPLVCAFFTPLYGLSYFLTVPIVNKILSFIIFIALPYLSAAFGCFLGKVIRDNLDKKEIEIT
ncbi:MAG: hypothetical protein H7Y18_02960 [Clostridiaceae bacterium]|nr:hypothetical protein [Clostridiaceae bacterium]